MKLIPVRINDDSQPVPLAGEAGARLDQRLAALGTALTRAGSDVTKPGAMAEYEAAAYSAHSRSRARSHRYFLRNAYRFPPRILVGQVTTYVRNRLAERGWMSQPAG